MDGRRLHFEVSEAAGAAQDWGFIWGHGLTSSIEDTDAGGWPFAEVTSLADVAAVVRKDARGHGRSDSAADATWPAMGRDLLALRRAWGKRNCILGGTSMGSAAAILAALEDPAACQGLVLATPPTCHGTRRNFVPSYRENVELARREGLQAVMEAAAQRARPPIFAQSPRSSAFFEIGWRAKFAMGTDRYCAAVEGSAASDLPPFEELRRLTMPTLILAWKSDVQHPVSTAERLHAALPNTELHVASTWDEVEEFPQKMRAFVERLVRG